MVLCMCNIVVSVCTSGGHGTVSLLLCLLLSDAARSVPTVVQPLTLTFDLSLSIGVDLRFHFCFMF